MWHEDSTEEAWLNFSGSIKSQYTLTAYSMWLRKFRDFCGVKTYSELLQLGDMKQTQSKILEWVMAEKKRKVRARTIGLALSALWHFYQYNDIIGINWVKLRSFMGEHQKVIKDRAYSIPEIRTVLKMADIKMRVVILLMVSAGLRIGSIPSLKIRNLEQLDGLYRITIYENTPEEYQTYCTPECEQAIKAYLQYRERAGETIKPDAPLVREDISIPNQPRPIGSRTLDTRMKKLLTSTGVREKKTGSRFVRHQVMLNHGFRKFYNTQMIKAGVKPVVKEMLIGHKTIGLESNYFRPTDEEMLGEYLKAVDLLTISTEDKLERENKELQGKLIGEEAIKAQLASLNEKYDALLKK